MSLEKSKETLGYYLDNIKKELGLPSDAVSQNLMAYVKELGKYLEEAPVNEIDMAGMEIRNLIRTGSLYQNIWFYSFLLNILKKEQDLLGFFQLLREEKKLSKEEKYFLYYQIKHLMFIYKDLDTIETNCQKWMLFREICEAFKNGIKVSLDYIPEEKRNPNLILFITEQMLGLSHAPTRTALERCAASKKILGKDVLLINTAESAPMAGCTPFYCTRASYYNNELKDITELEYDGVKISYMQCEQNMPRVDILEMLLLEIRRLRPCHIITLGGNSILANMANCMIPVLSVGLCFSGLEATETDYQTLGRKLGQEELELLSRCGKSSNHVIPTRFTFDLKPQTKKITHKDLGIPEDKFVSIVVGMRLEHEVTDAFAEMLECVMDEGDFVLFAGDFPTYDIFMRNHVSLASRSNYIGFQEEVLAVMECCDLFINPIRKGGGTSAVEAMVKGVPVVTTSYGDVACDVGEEFQCNDYQEMAKEILRYKEDKGYYGRQSALAIEKAKELLDSEAAFLEAMTEYERREREGRLGSKEENPVEKMLESACIKFQEGNYDEALEGFVAVYAKGYEREWILENIYNCYMEANDREFHDAYGKFNDSGLPPYESCVLDFIPYRDGEYFIFDKGQMSFYGKFSIRELQEIEADQAMQKLEFSAVALEFDWNWNLEKHILTGAKARKIYAVCHDMGRSISFYKIPELANYMKNVKMFSDRQQLQLYFHQNTSEYLPKLFYGMKEYQNILAAIMMQEHEYRLTPEGRNTENVLLTIGIPTFARGNLLLERVENLRKMYYDSEIEIAISKNGNEHFEEEYEKVGKIQDARINYVDQGEELVYIDNWRRTVAMAHGKYVLMVSDEDDVVIDALEHYLGVLRECPELVVVRARTAEQYCFIKEDRYAKKGTDAFDAGFLMQNYLSGLIMKREAFMESNMEELDAYIKNKFYVFYPHEWWCLNLYFMGDYKQDAVGLIIEGDVDIEKGLGQKAAMSPEEKLKSLPFYARYENRLEQAKDYLECIHLLEKRGVDIVEIALKKAFGKAGLLMLIAYERGYKREEYSEALGSLTELYISALDEFPLNEETKLRILNYFMEVCEYEIYEVERMLNS